MRRLVFVSFLQLVGTLFIVSTLVFFILRVLPGDPARAVLGMQANEQSVQRFRQEFGLDRPVVIQYTEWISGLVRFDFGRSFSNRQPVAPVLGQRLGLTLFLAVGGMICALLLALPMGVAAARKPWGRFDTLAMGVSHGLMAFPEFWIGMVGILLFSVQLKLFPLFGTGFGIHLVLPVLALGLNRAPILFRTLRGGLIQESSRSYALFFRGSGVPERRLFWKYLLRNQLPSVSAVAAIQFGYLLGGAIIIEQVFALPGLGRLLMSAILSRDLPVIQAGVILAALAFTLVGFATDIITHASTSQGMTRGKPNG